MRSPNNIDVLMFGWELPPDNSGGLGVACQGLAKSLVKLGTDISFALPRRLNSKVSYMKILDSNLTGTKVTAINSLLQTYANHPHYQTIFHTKHHTFLTRYGRTIYDEALRYAQVAKKWAKETPHHVIHAHDWMTYPAAIAAASVSRQPWVAHVHATEYDRTGGNVDPRIADIEFQGLNQADSIITVSQYTRDIVHRQYRIPQDKIHVVHNGIDVKDFKPQLLRRMFPRDRLVLYVGRLTYQKGVDYLLKAAADVLSTHPNTVFVIVGDGDMYAQHVLEAAALKISSRVIFTGFLTGQKLKSLYQLADVFVMPSVSEPYGLVALEAIASGTPVIISKQSGVAETIHHAYTVDFWDIHRMAGLITTLFDYPELAKELVIKAQKETRLLTWDNAAQKTLQVYQDLVH